VTGNIGFEECHKGTQGNDNHGLFLLFEELQRWQSLYRESAMTLEVRSFERNVQLGDYKELNDCL
jgi:hypothetical protein